MADWDLEEISMAIRESLITELPGLLLQEELDQIGDDILGLADLSQGWAVDPRARIAPHLLASVMRRVSLDLEYRFLIACAALQVPLAHRGEMLRALNRLSSATDSPNALRDLAYALGTGLAISPVELERRFFDALFRSH